MASQSQSPPVAARLDHDFGVIAADPPLLNLHQQAGGRIGSVLAVPQLVAIARLACRLATPIERGVVAATEDEDLELWVRAEPATDGVSLVIKQWTARPARWSRYSREAEPAADRTASGAEDLLTDGELRLVQLSPGLVRRLGPAARDAVGRSLARVLHPQEDDDGNLPLLAALAGRAPFTDQPALVRGTDDRVLLDGTPRFEGDRFLGYAVRVRLPAATEPEAAPLPFDEMLREPLAAIIEQAQLIAERSEGPLRNEYAGYGSDIAAAARHLLELVGSIGAEGEAGSMAPAGTPLDLAELVLEAAGLVQPQATARRVELDIDGLATLPARGQARSVTQILVNLIGNAVRFSPEGASVRISLEAGDQSMVIVSDQGPGVAPEDRVRIFEKFEQAGTNPGEAGLGLTISRRLARDMGGDVELLDGAGGASFRLRLPTA